MLVTAFFSVQQECAMGCLSTFFNLEQTPVFRLAYFLPETYKEEYKRDNYCSIWKKAALQMFTRTTFILIMSRSCITHDCINSFLLRDNFERALSCSIRVFPTGSDKIVALKPAHTRFSYNIYLSTYLP